MSSTTWPRTVTVPPDRLAGWLAGFAERHGTPAVEVDTDALVLQAADGAAARVRLLWGPLPEGDPLAEVVAAFARPRRVGALIVRRKAHAVGIFVGSELVAGRRGSHYVQGRTKAGGWSQQRYARRRANQAERSFEAAGRDAADLLVGEAGRLDALALGGDGAAVASVLALPELARLAQVERRLGPLSVPDPNARVLAEFGALFRRVPIDLNELA
ncbi:MAG TPA: acVLRF1 family peptidyl-tRNA hydrolase [Propionicimonas sp.]|nr:acVLRF1 family peptidyl-tRNA hydrolase [Propionicimonas sp.]HQA78387.1 acVLRF1 family peptidyl-tRNA hydrolase [Propionicimonas sp.]HQD97461.1 acVLRF1 family peptidyl-tRNA hydrolase [Propionicimonas sp.]